MVEAEEKISSDSESNSGANNYNQISNEIIKKCTSSSLPFKKTSLRAHNGSEIAVSKEIFFALRKRNIKDDYKLQILIGEGNFS